MAKVLNFETLGLTFIKYIINFVHCGASSLFSRVLVCTIQDYIVWSSLYYYVFLGL